MNSNLTNYAWQAELERCLDSYDVISKPRDLEVREVIGGHYHVPMPAYLDLVDRKVNVPFMFAEAAWIVSGSNRLSDVTPHMKGYANFSDDGVFLRGAYGPKVVDQLGYVVDSIEKDNDTRQAVINIWRERPGPSKDIPCTLSMQFLLRNGVLNAVVTMRSQDIVLGFTYDVFTFSMVAKAVQLLLRARGVKCDLGILFLRAGSLHLYERHYEDARRWIDVYEQDKRIGQAVEVLSQVDTYEQLIKSLEQIAIDYKEVL